MINTMLLFGATGDLAGRLLLPALASLHASDLLPAGFHLIATSRRDWEDAQYRQHMTSQLDQHAAHIDPQSRRTLVEATTHIPSDAADPSSIESVIRTASGEEEHPIAMYLALPQGLFTDLAKTIGQINLPQGSRLAIEKPFGENLDDAIALNRALNPFRQRMGNGALYLVDHVLGMETVQNLIGLRFANKFLESVWNSDSIEQVDVLWEETLALEGRANFYDQAGALKDVLQNHMIQVLCYAGMEPPLSLDARDVQDRKVEFLNSIQPLTREDVVNNTRRARYTAGKLTDGGDSGVLSVPNYVDEEGVDAARQTETFAEIILSVDNERWRGTRFLLRTAKAFAEQRKEIVIHFRADTNPLFEDSEDRPSNALRIGIDGPTDIDLRLNASAGEDPGTVEPLVLTSPSMSPDLPPYARVLLDILNGGSGRSVRGDEAEAAWRVVMPVLDGWAQGLVPMEEYPAGSAGPVR